MSEVAVLGLGVILMQDDAFGPHVIHALEAGYTFPDDVDVLELGTPGFDLVPYMTGRRAVILVDTAITDGPPGTIRLYRRDALLKVAPSPRPSAHQPTVLETLLSLQFSGSCPEEVLLVGVVPKSCEKGTSMSAELHAAIPGACEEVLEELARLGVVVTRRAAPVEAQVWWEAV